MKDGAEIAQLDQIERVIETNEPMAIIQAAEASQIIGQLQQNMQTESDEKLFESVYGDEDAFFAAKADQVLQNQLIDQAFSPDIQHLKIALNDIQRKYPDVKIEMTQNYATLSDTEKQYFDGRGYGKGMNGYYNDQTDTVVIFADNIQNTDHLEKTFAHETAGHKGLQVLLGNEYTSIIDEIYSAVNQKHGAELQELAATYGQDLNTIEGQRYIIEEYLANQADLKQLSGFKSFVQKIKLALRKVGFRAKWTDDEIATLMRRSLENIRKQRSPQTGNNNGARFSIIGEKGAAALDAYSYQNNLDNLQTAKQMFEAGEDAADIKLATGWEKGGDGKWRMEVPDLTVIIKRKLPDGNEYNVDSFAFQDDYLENIVNAPELFSAYGQLRRIRVRSVDLDSLGSYSKKNNTIYLNYNDFINLPTPKQELLLRSVLIHEVQHAIQDIEGFASGGTLNTAVNENQDPVLQRHIAKANELMKERESLENKLSELEKSPEENEKQISSIKHRIERIETLLDTNRLNAEMATSPQTTYKRLAGEVEARNAERRQFFTEEEKRNSLLEASEDVAEESKIYLFDNAGENGLAVGDKFSQIKDALRQEEGKVPLFTEKYNSVLKVLPKLAEIFSRFPNDIVAADGATVLIKNPDKGKLSERLNHLITQEDKNNGDRNSYDIDKKIPWLPRIIETLENAQAKLKDPVTGNFAYVRSYTEGKIHTVLVSESGSIQEHDTFDHGLITQFAERFAGRRNSFDVVWERNASKQKSSLQTASQMGSQEKFPRPLRQGKFTSNSQKVKQFIEKNQEKMRFSISPVDGDGFVSTADREKMITVLMGIPQQQLDNMDYAAALDYLTQKQFKVPSDDMAQSLLNTARQRRKDIIKQFADKRRKNWIMDNYPFYRALVELGGENAKVLLPKGEIYKNYSGSFFARGKLKNGTAVPLKDIVDKIQASGTDTKNLEGKILKFFDGLNISKLQQAYRDSMFDPASKTVQEHENYLLNKLSENKIFSEKEAAELQTLKEKYNALGLDLNIDNINIDTAQPAQTAEKLEPVTNLSADQKQQLTEEYKIKVQNIRSKYQSLAREAIERQRTKLIEAYRERLAKIKDMVKNDRINLQAVQKQAAQFAREYLPKEQQAEFITGILNLGKYSNKTRLGDLLSPRQRYLNALLDNILDKSLKVAKNDNLAKLLKLCKTSDGKQHVR